ncbi:ReoY family proteolytic degradation factor [Gracilibacillus sp. YIM 98692]|uniref:ReoY family proteolytic degradation factor n=1 Tax=Gracilibacillus sp. YIM 98692 TaxID=2663532 RepID=UPI0013D59F55|nr:ReoY family proteolytic degradation factor [Gracilibacillus sp. YIM 98692]
METSIKIEDKKEFIQWFLGHYQLKKRESVWILNYLMNHEEILEHVHFVLEARFCPRAMIISTHCSKDVAFRFYKKHIVTTDADKSFHDIRLHCQEPIYIQLNFKGSKQSVPFMKVLEDNPFIPDDYFLSKQDKKVVDQWLDYSIYYFKKEKLTKQINKALDDRDQAAFKVYAVKLEKLEQQYAESPLLND